MLTRAQLIRALRQFAILSNRTGKSYAPQVDVLVALAKAQVDPASENAEREIKSLDELASAEYPERFRSFKPARPV